jgi:hypothetical protein
MYAPKAELDQEEIEQFYVDVSNVYETVPKYDAVVLMCDFNAKIGKEISYQEVVGKYTLRDVTSGYGQKLIGFAKMHNIFAVSTIRKYKIHTGTWIIPGTIDTYQIDHGL